jgi:hypothetical protein
VIVCVPIISGGLSCYRGSSSGRLLHPLQLFVSFPRHTLYSTVEDDFTATIKLILNKNFVADWQGIEKLPGIKWAPLPPTMLQNCLPDGGCFTRQGMLVTEGRNLVVIATGARTIVTHIYFRNSTTPIGEAAILTALKAEGLSAELARCPARGSIGGTNWYRLNGMGSERGYLSVQTSCNGKPCEGFSVSLGEDLPPLQPNQLSLYSEKCSATDPGDRKSVSTVMPHEQLAQIIVTLLPQESGPAFYNWKMLTTLLPATQWTPGGAKKGYGDEINPWGLSGQLRLSQRGFSLLAIGSPTQVKTISFEEMGLHPRGEDLLGVLRANGFNVRLSRCGPVYTESTNNWYSLGSAKTRPVMLRQSLRVDGKQLQDTYELRLDNSLPKRDPRDRDPGVDGCNQP